MRVNHIILALLLLSTVSVAKSDSILKLKMDGFDAYLNNTFVKRLGDTMLGNLDFNNFNAIGISYLDAYNITTHYLTVYNETRVLNLTDTDWLTVRYNTSMGENLDVNGTVTIGDYLSLGVYENPLFGVVPQITTDKYGVLIQNNNTQLDLVITGTNFTQRFVPSFFFATWNESGLSDATSFNIVGDPDTNEVIFRSNDMDAIALDGNGGDFKIWPKTTLHGSLGAYNHVFNNIWGDMIHATSSLNTSTIYGNTDLTVHGNTEVVGNFTMYGSIAEFYSDTVKAIIALTDSNGENVYFLSNGTGMGFTSSTGEHNLKGFDSAIYNSSLFTYLPVDADTLTLVPNSSVILALLSSKQGDFQGNLNLASWNDGNSSIVASGMLGINATNVTVNSNVTILGNLTVGTGSTKITNNSVNTTNIYLSGEVNGFEYLWDKNHRGQWSTEWGESSLIDMDWIDTTYADITGEYRSPMWYWSTDAFINLTSDSQNTLLNLTNFDPVYWANLAVEGNITTENAIKSDTIKIFNIESPLGGSISLNNDLTDGVSYWYSEVHSLEGFDYIQSNSCSLTRIINPDSLEILTGGDDDDFLNFSTTADQPKINFVGSDGLITADGGTINFDNEHLTTTGNFTGNQLYGEMWNYTTYGNEWTYSLTDAGIYYNMTNLSISNNLNGFSATHNNQENGGSYLTANVAGLYKADLSFSSELTTGATTIVSYAIVKNFDVENSRNCYARRAMSLNSPASITVSCFVRLSVSDNINVQIEAEASARDIDIHAVNLNIVRIGN